MGSAILIASVLVVGVAAGLILLGRRALYVYLAGFGLRFVLVLADAIWGFLPRKPDEEIYHRLGETIASGPITVTEALMAGIGGGNQLGVKAYGFVVAGAYYLFGTSEFVMPLLNALVYSVLVAWTARTLKSPLSDAGFRWPTWPFVALALFAPGGLSVSMYNIRDTLAAAAVVVTVLLIVLPRRWPAQRWVVVAGFLATALLRPVMAAIPLAAAVLSSGLGITAVAGLSSVGLVLVIGGSRFVETMVRLVRELPAIVSARLAGAANPYPVDGSYDTYLELLADVPRRLFYYFMYPFPWQPGSYQFVVPTFEAMLMGALFVGWLASAYIVLGKRPLKVGLRSPPGRIFVRLSLVCMAGFAMLSVAETMFTGAIRHRLGVSVLFYATTSLGLIEVMSPVAVPVEGGEA